MTIDTSVVAGDMHRLRASAAGLGIEFVMTTVTQRENFGQMASSGIPEGSTDTQRPTASAVFDWSSLAVIDETAILDESRVGMAVLGGNESAALLQRILGMMRNDKSSKPQLGGERSCGEMHQLRDALMLEAHVRSGHDILVSNDVKGFIGKTGETRAHLEELCETRIMTVDEFCAAFSAVAPMP